MEMDVCPQKKAKMKNKWFDGTNPDGDSESDGGRDRSVGSVALRRGGSEHGEVGRGEKVTQVRVWGGGANWQDDSCTCPRKRVHVE